MKEIAKQKAKEEKKRLEAEVRTAYLQAEACKPEASVLLFVNLAV